MNLVARQIYGDLRNKPFITTWDTTKTSTGSSLSNQILLPIIGTLYDFTVYWGDGTSNKITSAAQTERLHTYATAGVYTIKIVGLLQRWAFKNIGDRLKLLTIEQWGCFDHYNESDVFSGCENLTLLTVTDTPNLKNSNSLNGFFQKCSALTTVNKIANWDTSTITNPSYCFRDCTNFNDDISAWNMSNVISITNMFNNAVNFNQPLNSWNTANFTDISLAFQDAKKFNKPLNSWNMANVTNMSSAFYRATDFNQPLSSWNTANVTNMSDMFYYSKFNQDISSWNTSKNTSMASMFERTPFNQDISSWNTSKVTNMNKTFFFCNNFNQPLNSWDVSKVTSMREMFNSASSFNQPLSSWNTTNVTDMYRLFADATAFNQNIGSWNVSKVTNFQGFMRNKSAANFSASNLDAIYNGWSTRALIANRVIDFNTIKYTAAGVTGRGILTSAPKNMTITDGGI